MAPRGSDSVELALANADLLLELIGDARVVAIGEGAHNVQEFTGFADGLFRLLAERRGFTGFVKESGFAEGLSVDDWLHDADGVGDAGVEAIARAGISYGFGESEQVRAQLSWLRDRVRAGAKLQFIGADLPGSSTSPEAAVRQCLQRIPAAPDDAALLRASELGDRTEAAIAYAEMSPAEQGGWAAAMRGLALRAIDNGDAVAAHCGASILALLAELQEEPAPDAPYAREVFLADSVMWALERHERVLVSAHNSHLRKDGFASRPSLISLVTDRIRARGAPADSVCVLGMTYGSGPEVRFQQLSSRPFDCEVTLQERRLLRGSFEERIEHLLGNDGAPALVLPALLPPETLAGVEGTQASGGVDRVDDFSASFDALIHLRHVVRVPGAFERMRAEFATGRETSSRYRIEQGAEL
ncbi:MAG: erythromycin esterase family protein [Actinobacteria bacterium]|nr:erythromycin esterase family protein [Actinomycetota bacterium]